MGCCTKAEKAANHSCEAGGLHLPLSHSVTIALSHLFSVSLSFQSTVFFFSSQPAMLTILEFSSALRLLAVESQSSNNIPLFSALQMGTKTQT